MSPHYGSIISVNHMITLTSSEKPLNCFFVAETLSLAITPFCYWTPPSIQIFTYLAASMGDRRRKLELETS